MDQTLNSTVTLSRKERHRRESYRGYHPIVWFLIIGTAVTRMASFMSLPFLAIHLSKTLQLNPFMIGLTLGMSGLTGALGGFIGGYLSDRWSRRLIILCSFSVWTGVFFSYLFAEDIYDFLILNGLNGVCRSFFEPTSQALMADVSPKAQRFKIFSYRYIAINVGTMIGPLVGSFLYHLVGMKIFFYTGIVYTVYLVCLIGFLFKYYGNTGRHTGEQIHFSECCRVLRRDSAYFVLAGVLFFTVYTQIDSSIPIFLTQELKIGDQLYPVLLAAW
jgi:MFS family permease